MIEVKSVTHHLGEKLVLENVNLNLKEGSVMGLVGINGAGKSTLLRLIAGVYRPDVGEILCDGRSVSDEKTREKIFFLPDDPYYTTHTTGHNLWQMYQVFYPWMDREVYLRYLTDFHLDDTKPLRNFSKGMRRQLYVALALSVRPKYLLLDEAFDGLDPLARLNFKKVVNRAVEEDGTSVLISSHSLRELEDFCDSYALIDNHTVAESGAISDHINRFCKFQLAFLQPAEKSLFSHLPVVSMEQNGRFVRLVLEGENHILQKQLEALGPVIIEEMPMDFEELFLYEVGKGEGKK